MYGMFRQAHQFNQDISNWDVSLVENMAGMFNSAYALNQDLSGWDISNVTNMFDVFGGSNSLSEENQCAIHTSWSTNSDWPYDWSDFLSRYLPTSN